MGRSDRVVKDRALESLYALLNGGMDRSIAESQAGSIGDLQNHSAIQQRRHLLT